MQSELSDIQVGCCLLCQAWFWCSSMWLSVFLHSWRWVLTLLVLMFWDRLRRCPLTVASQLGDERQALVRPPFLDPYPCVQSAARWCCHLRSTSDDLNHLHAGLELQPPVTSFTCRFAPFLSLQGLEVLVVSWTWTCPFSLHNDVFKWNAVCTVLAPLFTSMVHLSWPSKLGQWQQGHRFYVRLSLS